MTDTAVLEIAMMAMTVALKLSAPILVPALVVGFLISLVQSMTQIQEFTLAFVPKLLAVGVSLLFCGNWMLATLIQFTDELFKQLGPMIG